MNESKIILECTNFKRLQNFKEDKKLWKEISEINLDNQLIKIEVKFDQKQNKRSLKFRVQKIIGKRKNGKLILKTDKDLQNMMKSLSDKILRVNKDDYNIKDLTDLKLWMIKDYAKIIYNLDKKIQLHFCRDPSRQTFGETVQIGLLQGDISKWSNKRISGLNPNFYTVERLAKKESIVSNGKILNPKIHKISKKQISRSLDVKINSEKITAYGTLKYSEPVGGLTTDLQPGEEKDFIKEFNKYCENPKNRNDNVVFFVQADGTAAKLSIPELKKLVENKERIFVGTAFEVIKWLNSKISN